MKDHRDLYRTTIALTLGLFLGITATGANAKTNSNHITSKTNNQIHRVNQIPQNKQTGLKQIPANKSNTFPIQHPTSFNQRTNHLYHHIISSGINKNSSIYRSKINQNSIKALHSHRIHSFKKIHYHKTRRSVRRYFNKIHKSKFQSIKAHKTYQHPNWFRDGLSRRNYNARAWVSWHESNHRWRVLSYGHVCVGYFQLNPHYLGYRHGHVDLRPKHQVKVADRYVRHRYGNWINAQHFWQAHHWY